MTKIKTTTDLKTAILLLEEKQAFEIQLLKEQFFVMYENMQPMNLLKSTFKNVVSSSTIKDTIIGSTVGATAGYLSKKVVSGTSHNPIKQLLGVIVQLGITNIVSRNPESIKYIAGSIINLLNRKKTPKQE